MFSNANILETGEKQNVNFFLKLTARQNVTNQFSF